MNTEHCENDVWWIGQIKVISSRHDDDVANAYWNPNYRKFKVNANHRDNRNPDNGGREEISRNTGITL